MRGRRLAARGAFGYVNTRLQPIVRKMCTTVAEAGSLELDVLNSESRRIP